MQGRAHFNSRSATFRLVKSLSAGRWRGGAWALVALAAGGCASVEREAITPEAQERLAAFERTGEVRNCIGVNRIDRIEPLDERHFLIRVGLNDYYLNEVPGRCGGAGRFNNRIQYVTSISQLCRNEIITIVDNATGFITGSCGLGGFERLVEKPEDETENGTEDEAPEETASVRKSGAQSSGAQSSGAQSSGAAG